MSIRLLSYTILAIVLFMVGLIVLIRSGKAGPANLNASKLVTWIGSLVLLLFAMLAVVTAVSWTKLISSN